MTQRTLPVGAISYAKSSRFQGSGVDDALLQKLKLDKENTREIPEKLLGEHDTKAGTWGLLQVLHGEVQFFLSGQSEVLSTVNKGETEVIFPEEKHRIATSDDAVFFIEFFRLPEKSN